MQSNSLRKCNVVFYDLLKNLGHVGVINNFWKFNVLQYFQYLKYILLSYRLNLSAAIHPIKALKVQLNRNNC